MSEDPTRIGTTIKDEDVELIMANTIQTLTKKIGKGGMPERESKSKLIRLVVLQLELIILRRK